MIHHNLIERVHANDSQYGPSAAVFTSDIANGLSIARRIKSGICHINGPTVHDEAQMPFGGVGSSGYGRFGGKDMDGAEFTMNSFTLRRVKLDLSTNSRTALEEELFDRDVTSFTRIDERFYTKQNRYIWVQYTDPDQPFHAALPDDPRLRPVNSYGRFDVIDRTLKSYFVGPDHVLQEPVFVPRSANAEEGDGWILGTAHNLVELRSELVILDAQSMIECARVILPFRNAYQVHAIWASTVDLPLACLAA